MKSALGFAALVALAALGLAGCQSAASPPDFEYTPPPAAGYRAKTPQGVDLTFDARYGVYAVTDRPGVYWLDQRYFRDGDARWETGPGPDGPWSECAPDDLPAGLR